MGVIIEFSRLGHDRASTAAVERAANSASVSAVKDADFAVGVSRIDCHHSAGIRSRCHHLRAVAAPTPISPAMAPGEDQRPMMERNEAILDMANHLGQFVLNDKANVSRDCGLLAGLIIRMPGKKPISQFEQDFIERTKLAREATRMSQDEFAGVLGDMEQGTYKQYESRSVLPHRYVLRFCQICHIDIDWLYDPSKGQGPASLPKKERRRGRAKRARAA